MADAFVQLPPDGAGKRLDAEDLTVSALLVHRERMQIAGAIAAAIAGVLNTDPTGSEYAILSRLIDSNNPLISDATSVSVAAGASVDLDSTQLSSGVTGKLLGLIVTASVPFKAELKTVLNGVPTSKVTYFSSDRKWDWRSPARDFISVTQSATPGLDAFRVTVTNLDTSEAADLYATFFYDEV